jgi:DNA-binding MarR family transcriptional regulator
MLRKQEYIGLLIAAARRGIQHAVRGPAGRYGLDPQEFWLLLAVHEDPGQPLGDLAKRMRIEAPAMSRRAALLLDRKLVRLQPDPADRRRSLLVLTAAGAALARRIQPTALAVRAALVQGMSEAEQQALRNSLEKVLSNLDRFGGGAAELAPARKKRRTA